MGEGKTVEGWDAWTEKMKAAHGNGNGHGKSLAIEVQRESAWAEYAPAIARQEATFGRPSPAPTVVGGDGKRRIAAEFLEWMMGLPLGHVTDPAIGISRDDMRKALGNGVVPQQAAAATRAFLADMAKAVAA